MKFFLDNNLSPKYAEMLRALGVDARHLAEVEQLSRDAPDTKWIPYVASQHWVAVGGDERILRDKEERACVSAHGLVYYVFSHGFQQLRFWEQALVLVRAWPTLAEHVQHARPGECFTIKWSTGKIEEHHAKRR